ncbi:hypothetical protein D9V32_08100 [Mycetocola tolaasinivorans]|uniref:Uncharacterized protein n=2 Tax=Mycetocola tolaasinivorans TaxID=76635 RepID=A0A3L7A8C4_9MICO|nr:hypothetical protein D9V32_08100 [Mycetocola tolaasinivorans]
MDPTSPQHALVAAGVLGALTLIDPAKRSPLGRLALRAGIGVTSGVLTWVSLGREDSLARNPLARLGVSVGAAGATMAASELGEKLDARLMSALNTRGLRHPRAVLALGTGAIALAQSVADMRDTMTITAADEHPEHTVELETGVSDVIAGMLEFTGDHSSTALRAQLATAREIVPLFGIDSGDSVHLSVDEHAPRAVPHTFVFPVKARFRSYGIPVEASLEIEGGRMSRLITELVEDATGDHEDPVFGEPEWPARADISFVLDSPEPSPVQLPAPSHV